MATSNDVKNNASAFEKKDTITYQRKRTASAPTSFASFKPKQYTVTSNTKQNKTKQNNEMREEKKHNNNYHNKNSITLKLVRVVLVAQFYV